MGSTSVQKNGAWHNSNTGTQEPVSGTSKRGAKVASIPEISARGSLLLWAVVSDTSRPPIWQGGRNNFMSAPRP